MNPRDTIAAILKVRDENVLPSEVNDNERAASADYILEVLTAAGYPIVGPADMEAEDLDSRMKAAGMVPLSDLIAGNTPLERWMAHTGVRDLDTFEQWLTMRQREIGHLMAAYELGDKDKTDELYEWVHSHFSALNEVAANLRQMKRRMAEAASPHMPVPAGWVLVPVAALKWLNGEGPDGNGHGFGDAPDDNGRGAAWWRTKFNAMLASAPKPPPSHRSQSQPRGRSDVL